MFDTHCHLFDKTFASSLDTMIVAAREVGVKHFLVPAVSLETSRQSVSIANTYASIYSAVGIHPTEKLLLDDIDKVEKTLNELCLDKNVVALGETGLDYYRFKSSADIQKRYLEMHIKLAVKHEKAIVLHNRHSTKDILSVLASNWQDQLNGKIVLHCSPLENEIIEFSEKYDIYLGIDGDITYDKFKQDQLRRVSTDKLLLETDSPYLLPEPLKSQKAYPNTPENLNLIADFASKLIQMNKSDFIEITTRNALRAFSI